MREYTYNMDHGNDIARFIARERYAWPGGYELFAITDDGAVLCCDCCRTEYRLIAEAYHDMVRTGSSGHAGWNVVALDSTANCDIEPVICDHCSRVIHEGEETS